MCSELCIEKSGRFYHFSLAKTPVIIPCKTPCKWVDLTSVKGGGESTSSHSIAQFWNGVIEGAGEIVEHALITGRRRDEG